MVSEARLPKTLAKVPNVLAQAQEAVHLFPKAVSKIPDYQADWRRTTMRPAASLHRVGLADK